ncbi:uncharacterized protein [Prorops nasuta]|uniref:uncharacterized protein n=1 Tax=Prorops nasuta TaxID=863751 RepID=UPI0034CF8514
MGLVLTILEAIEEWLQDLDASCEREEAELARIQAESKAEHETVESSEKTRQESFLNDQPILRDLLQSFENEHSIYDDICTINRLLFFYVIIKWLNFETWFFFGGGPFAMNRLGTTFDVRI